MNLQRLKSFPRTLFATLAKEEEDGPGNQHSFERPKNGDTSFLSSTNLFLLAPTVIMVYYISVAASF